MGRAAPPTSTHRLGHGSGEPQPALLDTLVVPDQMQSTAYKKNVHIPTVAFAYKELPGEEVG